MQPRPCSLTPRPCTSPTPTPPTPPPAPSAQHLLVARLPEALIHHQDGAPVQAVADAAAQGLAGKQGGVGLGWLGWRGDEAGRGRVEGGGQGGRMAAAAAAKRDPPPELPLATSAAGTRATHPPIPTRPPHTPWPPTHHTHTTRTQPTWLSARKACCEYHTSPDTRLSWRCPRSLNAFFSWTCAHGQAGGRPNGATLCARQVGRGSQCSPAHAPIVPTPQPALLPVPRTPIPHHTTPPHRQTTQHHSPANLEILGGGEGDAHDDHAPSIAVGKVQALRHLRGQAGRQVAQGQGVRGAPAWGGRLDGVRRPGYERAQHPPAAPGRPHRAPCPTTRQRPAGAHLAAADCEEGGPAPRLDGGVVLLHRLLQRILAAAARLLPHARAHAHAHTAESRGAAGRQIMQRRRRQVACRQCPSRPASSSQVEPTCTTFLRASNCASRPENCRAAAAGSERRHRSPARSCRARLQPRAPASPPILPAPCSTHAAHATTQPTRKPCRHHVPTLRHPRHPPTHPPSTLPSACPGARRRAGRRGVRPVWRRRPPGSAAPRRPGTQPRSGSSTWPVVQIFSGGGDGECVCVCWVGGGGGQVCVCSTNGSL